MGKQKRGEKKPRYLMKRQPRIFSRFYLAEIDMIMEDRLSRDVICRGKRKSVSNITMAGNDNITEYDLISKLPEEILCSIIPFLTMREAVTTSVLSRRWRYLWRTSLSLDFDVTNMTGDNSHMCGFRTQDPNYSQQDNDGFVRWVNQILALHCGARIESFRVEHWLGVEYSHDIDQWIQFAVDKKVQKLDIHLSKANSFSWLGQLYVFPYWLFSQDGGMGSTLKHLSLSACTLSLPPNFSSFSNLTSLTLKNTCVTEEIVLKILSNCLCLQWLSIADCCCPNRLKFASGCPPLKLKHLNISCCNYLKEIDICDAVNLASFEYRGCMLSRILFKNSAAVARLCFCTVWDPLAGVKYALSSIANDFPQLETLLLTSPHIKEDMIPKSIPTFTKLKHLVLMFIGSHPESLMELTTSLLKASPLLYKLELHLPIPSGKNKIVQEKIPLESELCSRHKQLREVEMYNFHGDQKEVELLVYLLNYAISLEKIKICRSLRIYQGDGEWLNPGSPSTIRRKQVHKMLRGKVPSAAKLIVM
uniref:F-box domain-containing protein n=1 Tax=Davidia involucrata TaxID=16924 RepID=A0A5B7B669_DAVIN